MAWMSGMAIHQLVFYFTYSGLTDRYPHLLGLSMPWPVLHGPFLFLYVSAMTQEKPLRVRQVLPHFIPFLMLTVLAIPFYLLSGEEKIVVVAANGKGYEWYILIHQALILMTGLGYVAWSLIRIHRHRSKIKQWFSNAEKVNLRWLEYLSIGLGCIWLLVLFFDDWIIFTGVVVFVLFIGVFGINQLPIFYSHPDIVKNSLHPDPPSFDDFVTPTPETDKDIVRYAKSGLKESEANDLHIRLTRLMEEKDYYKRNDITLADLAAILDTHPNYLSQVINEKEQKNFYQYIHFFRVRAFIQAARLDEKKHYTLLALAYDCGFNSKSTFNKYFKAYTGKSPSEYFSE